MKLLLIISLLMSSVSALNVAITIDDHPITEEALFSLEERTERFLNALEEHNCKAVFYCVGSRCALSAALRSLEKLSSSGHILANHSMHHKHLSCLTLDEFEHDLLEAEEQLKSFSTWKKWFRYPFLDYGNREAVGGSAHKAQAGYQIVKKQGYQEGYVTINTFDWHINSRLRQAINEKKNIDYEKLKTLYLGLIIHWSHYYKELYASFSETPVVHTLLLHANDLNALYLADMIELLKTNGWQIISPEIAMQHNGWMEKKLDPPFIAISQPPSLNCDYIDMLLAESECFK